QLGDTLLAQLLDRFRQVEGPCGLLLNAPLPRRPCLHPASHQNDEQPDDEQRDRERLHRIRQEALRGERVPELPREEGGYYIGDEDAAQAREPDECGTPYRQWLGAQLGTARWIVHTEDPDPSRDAFELPLAQRVEGKLTARPQMPPHVLRAHDLTRTRHLLQ